MKAWIIATGKSAVIEHVIFREALKQASRTITGKRASTVINYLQRDGDKFTRGDLDLSSFTSVDFWALSVYRIHSAIRTARESSELDSGELGHLPAFSSQYSSQEDQLHLCHGLIKFINKETNPGRTIDLNNKTKSPGWKSSFEGFREGRFTERNACYSC